LKVVESWARRRFDSAQVHHKGCMDSKDKLNKLQENLAKDLVSLEETESVTKKQLDEIIAAYSKVYDIVTKIKSL